MHGPVLHQRDHFFFFLSSKLVFVPRRNMQLAEVVSAKALSSYEDPLGSHLRMIRLTVSIAHPTPD